MKQLLSVVRSLHYEDVQEAWFQYGLVAIVSCLTLLGLLVPYLEGWR